MSDPFFNDDFFRSLITTFFGAGLAILTAFGLWWLSGWERRKEEARRRSRLAQALGENLEANLEIAKSASEIEDDAFLTVNIDLSLLEATRSLKYEVMGDIDLSRDIDEVGYQFSSLHRLIDVRFEMEYSGSTLSLSNIGRLRTNLNSVIRGRGTHAIQFESEKRVVRRFKKIGEPTSPAWTLRLREWIRARRRAS